MGRSLRRWMFATGAVAGRSHEKSGTPCQDAVGAARLQGAVSIVLADGAGSARHSETGARLTVAATLQLLSTNFDVLYAADAESAQRQILAAVLARLTEEVQASGVQIADCASTLLFATVKDDRYIAGSLGDGVIACERAGRAEVLFHPLRGEHANETVFTTSRDAATMLSLKRGVLDEITSFALMSDGGAESLYVRREGRLASALSTLWLWLDTNAPEVVDAAIESNLRDLFSSQTGDDCSIGILRRVAVPAEQITTMDPAFQLAFLDVQSQRGLRTRLSVLREIVSLETAPTAEIATRTGLAMSTVRSHVRVLVEMLKDRPATIGASR